MEKPTVDLLIKDLDEHSLMDIMDIISQYELKYSVERREEVCCDNDFHFQRVMKCVIKNNKVLTESMRPLVDEYIQHIESYELNEGSDEELLEMCENMPFIK